MFVLRVFLVLCIVIVCQGSFVTECRDRSDFQCNEGTCISAEKLCNGRQDCPDHSDEDNCEYRMCLKPKWHQCSDNRTCLSHKFVCDGFENCPIGDDERGCGTIVEQRPGESCTKYEFTCLDKSCVPLDMVCDGKQNCADNSDEVAGCIGIELKCKGFLCKNKRCLESETWVCDGQDDCGDGSDEIGCISHCKVENRQFLCKDNMTCISLDKVCDFVNDCPEGSDEHGACNNTGLNCHSKNCPGECHSLSSGPVCLCAKGYQYNVLKNRCEDVNECELYGICSQGCVNTQGSYHCTCENKFVLKSDNTSCVVREDEPIMLYTTQRTVVGVHLKSRHLFHIAQNLSQVIGVTYDGVYIYWTDIKHTEESVVRAKIDGSNQEVLFTAGLEAPEDIAIDWYTGNIYFTDNVNTHLAVCSNNGHHCLVLIRKELDQPRGIVLDPLKGMMYWSDWGQRAMIGQASMDGDDFKPLVTENIHWPNGLSLDIPNNRIYWVDAKRTTLESIRLDGTDRRMILDEILKHPYEIAVFENKIYWSDWGTSSIHSCDKFTGKNHEVVSRDRKIYDIHIYHPALMSKGNHSCLGHHCTHLCLLSAKNSYSCACPEDMVLDVDKRTCKNLGKKEKLYLGIGNYLVGMEHTSFGRHNIPEGIPLSMFIHKMVYNSLSGNIFIADNAQRIIYEVDPSTKNVKKLITKDIGNITAFSFDHLANNLYWTDSIRQTIEVLSLQTKHRAIVHHFSGEGSPIGLVVLPQVGKLFVAIRWALDTHIDILSMNGRGMHHHFAEDRIGYGEVQFTVSLDSQTVFWLDSHDDKIEFTDYEGSFRSLFRALINHPVSMVLLEDDVVWSTFGSTDIFWTHRSNQGSIKKLSISRPSYMGVPDIIPIIASKALFVVDHPCLHFNGGCSHVCVSSGAQLASCLCPVGLVFKDMTNTTCIDNLDCEFRCKSGECVTSSRRCNGHKDCVDGSDEEGCDAKKLADAKVVCSYREFACHDGSKCIEQDLRCDHHPDCNDKSDEEDCEHYDHNKKCNKMQFNCNNGRCVDLIALCDGVDDCGDNSDETGICKTGSQAEKLCGDNMFKCISGQCIPKEWECDGHLDCIDSSDEHDKCAKQSCPAGSFTCTLGNCIDIILKCDGHNDCGDNSDENDCDHKKTAKITCNDGQFQCVSVPSMCIDMSARCNGTAECPRGEDEVGCHGCRINEFQCVGSKTCIRKEFRCDKEKDCADGSDELNCKNFNASNFHHFATACHDDMFDCKDGTCIDWLRVCDNIPDCSQGEDELETCRTACDRHPCEQKCTPSPYGPICGCHSGYRLSGNKKQCVDINECVESNPCSQLCENTYGSHRCTCYPEFMLRSDKASCKSVDGGHYLLFSSFDQVRKLSENPISLEIVLKANDSVFTGLDVNVGRNVVYFSKKDSGSLYEYNLGNGSLRFISDVGNPQKVAVDWITNNVYYIDESEIHSINVCYFSDKSACVRLIQFLSKDIVKTLAVDAINRYLFYSVMHYWTFGSPQSVIYKVGLDGTHPEVMIAKPVYVSAMECDSYKKVLYFTDLHTKTLQSVNYNADDPDIVIKHENAIVHPSGVSIYENSAFIINTGSPDALHCHLYGKRSCQAIALNVYNAEDIVVVAASRQKSAENICSSNNCSLLCVQAKLGPKCLCHEGQYVQPGVKCPEVATSGVGHRLVNGKQYPVHVENESMGTTSESSSTTLIVCLSIMGLILVGLGGYAYYRKRTGRGNFNVNIHFQNPLVRGPNRDSSNIEHGQAKMCRPVINFSKGRTELTLDSRKDSSRLGRSNDDSDGDSGRDIGSYEDHPAVRLVL